MEILDVMWFSGSDTIGIVATKNEMDEIKFYIGGVHIDRGDGYNENDDARKIADCGTKINIKHINSFFKKNLSK